MELWGDALFAQQGVEKKCPFAPMCAYIEDDGLIAGNVLCGDGCLGGNVPSACRTFALSECGEALDVSDKLRWENGDKRGENF